MDIDFGQILPNPTDTAYDPTYSYSTMDTCLDEYKSEWMSLVEGNKGHALPGYNSDGTAKKNAYWRCLINLYMTGSVAQKAEKAATDANAAASVANNAATNANTQAQYAEQEGNFAKEMAEHPTYIGNDGYAYSWDHAQKKYVRGAYMKGEGLDLSKMSEEEKAEIFDSIVKAVERDGGYVLYPVQMDDITTTSVFEKNSIISFDGVVYRAKQQTEELPFTLVVENKQFVTQVINGFTVFIKANDKLSSDWEVWLDASNDFRYKSLEARVARLETITG